MADHEWVGIHFVIIRWNVPYFLDGGDCKWISCNSVDSMYTGENYNGIHFCLSSKEAISRR